MNGRFLFGLDDWEAIHTRLEKRPSALFAFYTQPTVLFFIFGKAEGGRRNADGRRKHSHSISESFFACFGNLLGSHSAISSVALIGSARSIWLRLKARSPRIDSAFRPAFLLSAIVTAPSRFA